MAVNTKLEYQKMNIQYDQTELICCSPIRFDTNPEVKSQE